MKIFADMKPLFSKSMLGFLMMVLLGLYSKAQESESQVKVKITKEINGEKKTYEGTYESEEQMRSDEKLKEFMGDDQMNFSFDPNYNSGVFKPNKNGLGSFLFGFDDDDDMIQPNDSVMREFQIQMQKLSEDMGSFDIDIKDYIDKLHDEHVHVFGYGDDNDFDFQWTLPDSLDEQVKAYIHRFNDPDSDRQRIEVSVRKFIKISDNVDEFGKKGEVDDKYLLDLDELSYYPNPSTNGRFKLRFKTPEEGELSIKVYNLGGKEIFNRYFERFNGLYSETIDLSGQKEGIYLLEIEQDGKRLTRKIMID